MAKNVWDYHTGEHYIFIEIVRGDEVIGLVGEIPLDKLDKDGVLQAEICAERICNAHNAEE